MDAVPGESETLIGDDMTGLLVLRSLTKTWGLAGLRAGYVVGDPALVARLAAVQPHWSVNTLAAVAMEQVTAPAALAEAAQAARVTAQWRAHLLTGLRRLGLRPQDSAAPFVLVEVGAGVREALRRQGVCRSARRHLPRPGSAVAASCRPRPPHHRRPAARAGGRPRRPGGTQRMRITVPGEAPAVLVRDPGERIAETVHGLLDQGAVVSVLATGAQPHGRGPGRPAAGDRRRRGRRRGIRHRGAGPAHPARSRHIDPRRRPRRPRRRRPRRRRAAHRGRAGGSAPAPTSWSPTGSYPSARSTRYPTTPRCCMSARSRAGRSPPRRRSTSSWSSTRRQASASSVSRAETASSSAGAARSGRPASRPACR